MISCCEYRPSWGFLGDIAKKKGRDFKKEVSSLFSLDEED